MITPEHISLLVNFYSNSLSPEWKFDPTKTDMRNLQVMGAAKCCNLLEKEKLALLADEVGMGKTIQALAVCAALWNEKPNARVLIIAPRDEVAKNWEREYQTFISHHYRHNDNIVKSAMGDEPVREMIYCPNLYALVHQVQQGWGQLFIVKISSFSSLMAGDKALERLEKLKIKGIAKARDLAKAKENTNSKELKKKFNLDLNNELTRLLRNEIINHSGSRPFFDLIIIDEAHYLRNKEADSLKAHSAKILFGDPNMSNYTPISKKILLLTATPNHSSSNDIRNIVSYFSSKYTDKNYKDILDSLCIRRLRRLGSKAMNKYNYRLELPSPSDFKDSPLSEMFFGIYQHDLVREIHTNQKEKKTGSGISGMMKYLEGIEFLPQGEQQSSYDPEVEDDENKGNSTDYSKGSDAHILNKLSRKYKEIFTKYPSHPKYEKLVEDLTTKHNGEKAVVFVRRIPSVREITGRVIEFYDNRFWNILQKEKLSSLRIENLTRRNFNKLLGQLTEKSEGDGDVNEETVSDKNIPTSNVYNLFKVIKNDPVTHTAASNFRSRFNHSKPTIFSLFFSPAEDYFDKPYENLISFRYQVGKDELENYYNSALIHRTNKIPEKAISKDLLSKLLNKNPLTNDVEIKSEAIPTLFTIFWEVLKSDQNLSEKLREEIINKYKTEFSYSEKEAFSNFIEKGTLLASEAIVFFFEKYMQLQTKDAEKPLITYLNFCNSIKEQLTGMRLYKQIIESILHFKVIYTKVFSINNENQLLDESWDSFNNAQPIYPYNADNKNNKVLKCFNTPFYPDMLVATSVLQEGVNLQYFCNTVYHYGMAWTPGDNEQRIGRIDRMFGKIERLLEEKDDASLNIYYPFLKDTIDEEHLGRFAKRKFREESLIDMGKAFEETSDYALEENEINGWQRFFRKPDHNNMSDPFPAIMNNFLGISNSKPKFQLIDTEQYYSSIIEALELLENHRPEVFYIEKENNKSILADTTLNNDRKQPVIIELVLDNIGSGILGEAVYCLKMKTPIAPLSQFKMLRNRFYNNKLIKDSYLPGIKLCLDPSHNTGSSWAIYMVNDLPLFIRDLHKNPLSVEEIQISYLNLIKCADLTEKEIFNKDLRKEELNLPLKMASYKCKKGFRKAEMQKVADRWVIQGDFILWKKPVIHYLHLTLKDNLLLLIIKIIILKHLSIVEN